MFSLILLVAALVLAALASYGVAAGRWSLGWAAFAFYVMSILVGRH